MSTNEFPAHDRYRADLAEHALGILDGRDRADLLAHVATCTECSENLQGLTASTDSLLHLPVGAEPPVGFESRVMERIKIEKLSPAPRDRRLGVLLSLAAAIVLFSFGVGWATNDLATRPATRPAASGGIEQRALQSSGHTVGLVYAYTGRSSWMFVTLDAPGAPASVNCVVITKDGERRYIGTFRLAAGKGAWGTPLPVTFRSVRNVELTSMTGSVVARLASGLWTSVSSRYLSN